MKRKIFQFSRPQFVFRTNLFYFSRSRSIYSDEGAGSAVQSPRVLITGALGQIGTELSAKLRKSYGTENVITSDVRKASKEFLRQGRLHFELFINRKGPYLYLDVLDKRSFAKIVVDERIDWLIHFRFINSHSFDFFIPLVLC